MEMTMSTEPTTARALLLGDGAEGVAELIHLLGRHGALREVASAIQHLAESGMAALTDEIAALVHGLLELDLGELALAGWRGHGELVAAARRTRATPGSSEVVQLARHTVRSVHEPWIDVLVHEVRVATVRTRLSVEFSVSGLSANVWDGLLVALHGGSCTITGTFSVAGRQLVKRAVETQPTAIVRLPGNGLPLLTAGRPGSGDDAAGASGSP
jgi:hypothetical protein